MARTKKKMPPKGGVGLVIMIGPPPKGMPKGTKGPGPQPFKGKKGGARKGRS